VEPYGLDDSCESGSFYIKNSRYQFNKNTIKSKADERRKYLMKRSAPMPTGKVVSFLEIKVTNSIAFVNLNPISSTMQ